METEIINENPKIYSNDVIDVLKGIFDPEIEYSIYDIGLIYKVHIKESTIDIVMTLTSINCPEAQSIPNDIEKELNLKFPDFMVNIEITFEPLWTVDNMSEEIQLKLGLL